jgi:hypothetical protein
MKQCVDAPDVVKEQEAQSSQSGARGLESVQEWLEIVQNRFWSTC